MEPEPVAPQPEAEELTETVEEVDELLETLAAESIVSEERHDEVMQEVLACRNQMETLAQQQQTENPMLAQIQAQITELHSRMEAIFSELQSLSRSRRSGEEQRLSTPEPSRSTETPSEPRAGGSTGEPVRVEGPQPEPQPERKRRAFKI
jgi:chromosome segregation ATPase